MGDKTDSMERIVTDWWASLAKRSKRGQPIVDEIALLDDVIARAEHRLNAGQMSQCEVTDFRNAKALHETKKASANWNEAALERWYGFWTERAGALEGFATQIIREGMKYTLALHGAAAITCINAIVSHNSSPFRDVFVFGAFAACFGIILIGMGQVILVEVFGKMFSKIGSSIAGRRGWTQVGAIARWVGLPQFRQLIKLAERLIYGSMIWFAIYVSICMLALA